MLVIEHSSAAIEGDMHVLSLGALCEPEEELSGAQLTAEPAAEQGAGAGVDGAEASRPRESRPPPTEAQVALLFPGHKVPKPLRTRPARNEGGRRALPGELRASVPRGALSLPEVLMQKQRG